MADILGGDYIVAYEHNSIRDRILWHRPKYCGRNISGLVQLKQFCDIGNGQAKQIANLQDMLIARYLKTQRTRYLVSEVYTTKSGEVVLELACISSFSPVLFCVQRIFKLRPGYLDAECHKSRFIVIVLYLPGCIDEPYSFIVESECFLLRDSAVGIDLYPLYESMADWARAAAGAAARAAGGPGARAAAGATAGASDRTTDETTTRTATRTPGRKAAATANELDKISGSQIARRPLSIFARSDLE
ncbi:MAG TPA: hypothetical protein VIE43_15065 [Thermoanaerobaculia bacterium]|jgi:hypothetical protein|nr:hypothetical protein [Thermoanaerobaculia bacterium]